MLLLTVGARAETMLIEASRLELAGGWVNSEVTRDEVRTFLVAGPQAKGAPAVGAVEISHAGKWRLWVRSKDFAADRPGSRHFSVRIGSWRSPALFGKHGKAELDGWAWEDGGVLEVPAGPALVVVGDEVTASARCDSLVLTDNLSYQPAGVPWKLGKTAAKMPPLTYQPGWDRAFQAEPLGAIGEERAALQNDAMRISFCAAGKAIAMRVEARGGTAEAMEGAESYRVLYRPPAAAPKLPNHFLHPSWGRNLHQPSR